jgi:5-methyltetrahydropteroyltriglutamate--homocysteine methyltransferase
MREEYEEIHQSGLTLQLDCPDLAAGRHQQFGHLDLQDWKAVIRGHVEAIAPGARPGADPRCSSQCGNPGVPPDNGLAVT